MSLVEDATDFRVGDAPVKAIYTGDTLVWPPPVPIAAAFSGSGILSVTGKQQFTRTVALSGAGELSATCVAAFTPKDIAGLQVWLDASTLGLADGASIGSQWSDLSGGGHHGAVVGSPSPVVKTGVLNGKRVVRFKPNEGKIRGDTNLAASGLPAPGWNYTIIYIARMVGPTPGRLFTGQYPELTNFVVGYYASAQDSCYDGSGFLNSGVGYSAFPTPWKIWGMTAFHTGALAGDSFYINGVLSGTGAGGAGLQSRWHLCGYAATGDQETCDGEVAEMLLWNRPLTDPERVAVENYLRGKWGVG